MNELLQSQKILVSQQMLTKNGNTLSEINAHVVQLGDDALARKIAGFMCAGPTRGWPVWPKP